RGILLEENRPDDPMEIDLAITNIANKITSKSLPSKKIVNATRKKPVRRRIVRKKKATRGRKRINLVTYEPSTENSDEEVYEPLTENSDEEIVEIVEEVSESDSEDNGQTTMQSAINLVKKKR